MKTIKFSDPLPEMILKGEKNVSWRIGDEKDLSAGDVVSLLRKPELKEFARVRIMEVKEKLPLHTFSFPNFLPSNKATRIFFQQSSPQ